MHEKREVFFIRQTLLIRDCSFLCSESALLLLPASVSLCECTVPLQKVPQAGAEHLLSILLFTQSFATGYSLHRRRYGGSSSSTAGNRPIGS